MSWKEVIVIVCLVLSGSGLASGEEVKVPGVDSAGKLVLPAAAKTALLSKWPGFVVWESSDYSKRSQQAAKDVKGVVGVSALIIDVNRDGRADVILDGHDAKESLLVGLVSDKERWTAKLIAKEELEDPKTVLDWDSGERDVGLSHWFVVSDAPDQGTPEQNVFFSIAFPQRTDAKGELANHGAVVDVSFRKGEFYTDGRSL